MLEAYRAHVSERAELEFHQKHWIQPGLPTSLNC